MADRSANSSPARTAVRDPFANQGALAAARLRTMSERLELALSWNAVAAELRAGIRAADGKPRSR